MEFELDPQKSAGNKDKHGIDFVEGLAIWDDDRLFTASAKIEHEQRFIATGKIGAKYWTAAYTLRNGRIRTISVRR